MAVVWMKWGDEALCFPLQDGAKMMVSSIARHWGLDPDSLRIADCALVPDADGNSVLSLDDMVALLQDQPDLGDGSSHDQALLVTGRRCSATRDACSACDHPAVQDLIRQRDEEDLVARKKQRREAAESRQRKAFHNSVKNLWPYVKELKGGGPFRRLRPEQARELLQSRVSKMVARLHFVEGDDEPSNDNYRGMAALVKPDGSCFTAASCCDRSSTSGRHVLVFSDPALEYECVVSFKDPIAVLTPIEPGVIFNYCINWNDWFCNSGSPYSWKRDPESGDIKCVSGIFLDGQSLSSGECKPYRKVMLPFEMVEVGAPVLDSRGNLGGIVVEFEEIPARNTRSKKNYGQRKFDMISIRDFYSKMISRNPDFAKALGAALEHRKAAVYEACGGTGLTTLWKDWMTTHPVGEFDIDEP
ncbi:uncharacterized protein LOC9642649 [Selaginella moellendorffii]|uniref:uncharacterized protein LOC9642649 n=1 Tax=Selaginella moellendorffii TaxID=88036 RepID=UPI000D1C4F2B|nr:uncharacterized protein LOC9642649 [Selaginella moellendorffii]|eukprot:XP_024533704.1 uncharacterized protein LOC9642649 [Selaginella moellendorffii]